LPLRRDILAASGNRRSKDLSMDRAIPCIDIGSMFGVRTPARDAAGRCVAGLNCPRTAPISAR